MPGQEDEAAAIFDWLANEVLPDTYVNIMGQYRPEHHVGTMQKYDAINRRPLRWEMQAAFEAARDAGLVRGTLYLYHPIMAGRPFSNRLN